MKLKPEVTAVQYKCMKNSVLKSGTKKGYCSELSSSREIRKAAPQFAWEVMHTEKDSKHSLFFFFFHLLSGKNLSSFLLMDDLFID